MPAITSLTISAAAPLGRALSGSPAARGAASSARREGQEPPRRDAAGRARRPHAGGHRAQPQRPARRLCRAAVARPERRAGAPRRRAARQPAADGSTCVPVTTVSAELFGTPPAPCYPPIGRRATDLNLLPWPILPSANVRNGGFPSRPPDAAPAAPRRAHSFCRLACTRRRPNALASKRRLHYTCGRATDPEGGGIDAILPRPSVSRWPSLAMHAGARADRIRPAGRRLCPLHGAVRRSRGVLGALRARWALPGLDLLLSGHGGARRQQSRDLLAEEPGEAAGREPLLRVRRQGRGSGRDAPGPGRERDRPHRRRLSQLRDPGQSRTSRPASRPAKARTAAAPGPSRGPATAGRRRAAISRTRSRAPRRRPCCMSGVVR